MATQTYNDGFPKTPQEAIEFSYFLTESEKNEWREWLTTATSEQQEELVDILHSMWQDNQKNAVPESFNPNVTESSAGIPQPPQTPADLGGGNFNFQPGPVPQAKPQNQATLEPPVFPQVNQTQFPAHSDFENQSPVQPQPPVNQQPQPPANQFIPQPPQTPADLTLSIPTEEEPSFDEVFNTEKFTDKNQSSSTPTTNTQSSKTETKYKSLEEELEEFNKSISQSLSSQEAAVELPTKAETQTLENSQETEKQSNKPQSFREDFTMENLVKESKYTPNPLLVNDDMPEETTNLVYKNSLQNQDSISNLSGTGSSKNAGVASAATQNNSENDINNDFSLNLSSLNNNTSDSHPTSSAVNFSELNSSGSKEILDEIYKDYLVTYDENQKKFLELIERITKVLSGYEGIAGHFKDLTDRVLLLNDTVVSQAKDLQYLKDITHTQSGTSIQDQIDDLRFDLDNLEKELKQTKTETRRKLTDISGVMAALGADTYKDMGVAQKIELLKADIRSIRESLNLNSENTSEKENSDSENQ